MADDMLHPTSHCDTARSHVGSFDVTLADQSQGGRCARIARAERRRRFTSTLTENGLSGSLRQSVERCALLKKPAQSTEVNVAYNEHT